MLSECLAAFTVVLGIIIALANYLHELEAQKARFTFDYGQEYYSSSIHTSRANLLRFVKSFEHDNPHRRMTIDELSMELSKSAYEDQYLAFNVTDNLLRILDHFNGALGCIRAGLCEAQLLNHIYRDEPIDIICIFGPTMQKLALDGGGEALLSGIHYFSKGKNCTGGERSRPYEH